MHAGNDPSPSAAVFALELWNSIFLTLV